MIRNYWYIACASSRLKSEPLPLRVHDQEVVLFRDSTGVAHALLDRCCHRGVRLSLGKVTDAGIACGYHGWEYDGAGKCIHIPSLVSGREIPAAFGVPAFYVCERDSYIWIWIGEKQPAEAPHIDLVGQEWMQGS